MIKQEILNGKIKVITFDAVKGNMLDIDDLISFANVIANDKKDQLIEGIIITGANRSFCTGVKAFSIEGKEDFSIFRILDELLFDLFVFPKPLVVAATGHSIGGGLLIQMCADFIVMSENMKIKVGFPELKLNTTLDSFMTCLIEYSVGNHRKIQDLIYTSEYIQPEAALLYRLTDAIVQEIDVFETALDKLMKLISYNAIVFRESKLSMRSSTVERMHYCIDKKCYEVFNNLFITND